MTKKLDVSSRDSILEDIDELESLFLQCRSVFPALRTGLVGHRALTTAPYYLKRGYAAQILLQEPITLDFIERNRRMGKWINENAIIRLYGILHHHGELSEIDKTLPGWKEVELMRRMRNAFTKTQLNYRPSDASNIKLREEVIRHFRLNNKEFAEGEIPTPIESVIEPIFKRCREYVSAKWNRDGMANGQPP